jgi:hypothetical protein
MQSSGVYFFILILLDFFIKGHLKKRFSYLDPDKCASFGGALVVLQGATMTGALAWTRRPWTS